MNKLTLFLLFTLSVFYSKGFAQTDSTYYKDVFMTKKSSASKANYVSFITTTDDGKTISELKKIKGALTIKKELNTGEQMGVWHYRKNKILNFDFNLNYIDTSCPDGMLIIKKPFEDDAALSYRAPVIDNGSKDVVDFLSKNLIYPTYARENGVSGKVIVHFVITSTGRIQDIAVTSSGDVSLDKEAMRVVRIIKLKSPPIVDGKPVTVCTSMPLTFKLTN